MALKLVDKYLSSFVAEHELDAIAPAVKTAHQQLVDRNGPGNDFLGWLDLPVDYDKDEFARIKKAAAKIKSDSQVLIVIGIGGSYLGARAVIEAIKSSLYNSLKKDTPEIYFIGNSISPTYLSEVVSLVDGKDFSVNIISKSGTTTEPAIATRALRWMLERKYGTDGAKKRIYAITDPCKGALRQMAEEEGWETFVIPPDVGGRFSVLSPVGLLPMAVAGIDIRQVMAGAAEAKETYNLRSFENPVWLYAATRNLLYRNGKVMEIFESYEPSFKMFGGWWQQLFGESEGKEHKGLFPASVEFTADLHSMGQYIQQGERSLFETVVRFGASHRPQVVPLDETDGDGLNFLAGKDVDFIRTQAMDGTLLAHVEGGVPNIILRTGQINAFTLGELIYFFEYACGLSGYLLDVNPFDQPGVEAYKKNMFALLGKPGYEALRQELAEKLHRA